MENQYTYRFDLNDVLICGYVCWFLVFAVKTWQFWRDPLRRALAWAVCISFLTEIEEILAKLLLLSLSRRVDYLAFVSAALPAILLMLLVGRCMRRPAKHVIGKIFRIGALVILSTAIGLTILSLAFALLGERLGGHAYNLGNPRDAARLRLMALGARPLIDALERFKRYSGDFPEKVEEMNPDFFELQRFNDGRGGVANFYYTRDDERSYRLYRKLSRDAGLFFERGVKGINRWYYDPGTGESPVHLPVPTPGR